MVHLKAVTVVWASLALSFGVVHCRPQEFDAKCEGDEVYVPFRDCAKEIGANLSKIQLCLHL